MNKKFFSLILLLLVLVSFYGASAQTSVPIPAGSALPATCTPGNTRTALFYRTGIVSPGLYQCTATNTWTSLAAPSGLPWGSITGTLSNQTDLQTVLNGKQATLVSGTNIKTVNGTTLLGSGDLTIATSGAGGSLDFIGQPANVDHGLFWTPDTDFGSCYWSAWIKPNLANTTGYYFSDGAGGAHTVLNGVTTNSSTFHFTGNIYDGTQIFTLGSVDEIPLNEWIHPEYVYNDGVNQYVFINGVMTFYGKINGSNVWSSTFTGKRHTPPGGSDGHLYVGGSYHNNCPCRIARARGIEGSTGGILATSNRFIPRDYNGYITDSTGATSVRADFTADYAAPGTRAFIDLGEGFDSKFHNGVFSRFDENTAYPTWVADEPAASTYVPTAPATPATALVFDSFSRVNSLFLFGGDGHMGSTETGSLGPKLWTSTFLDSGSGRYLGGGIFYGRAIIYPDIGTALWVQTDRNDVEVHWTRPDYPWASVGGLIRYKDVNNFYSIQGEDTLLSFNFIEAGVPTVTTPVTVPTGWTVLKAIASDTHLNIYTDGVLRASFVIADNALSVNHGFGPAGMVTRVDDFTVLPLQSPDTTAPSAPVLSSATANSDTAITMTWAITADNLAVTGYETRIDGGAWTDRGYVLTYQYTGLTASTSYNFEVRAYDAAGNHSVASNLIAAMTNAPIPWSSYAAANWVLNPDNSLEATATSFAGYNPVVVPQYVSIGQYIEFQTATSGGFVQIQLLDGSGDSITCDPNGTISSSGNPAQFLTPWPDGAVMRLTKISATQFSYSINGGGTTTINQTFSGTVTARGNILTVDDIKVLSPVTNIPF